MQLGFAFLERLPAHGGLVSNHVSHGRLLHEVLPELLHLLGELAVALSLLAVGLNQHPGASQQQAAQH